MNPAIERGMEINNVARDPIRRLTAVQSGTLRPALRKNSVKSGPASPARPRRSSTKNKNSVDVIATGKLLTSAKAKSRKAPAPAKPAKDGAAPGRTGRRQIGSVINATAKDSAPRNRPKAG